MLEYNSFIWSPHYVVDIDNIERVQRRFSKSMPGFMNTPYLPRKTSNIDCLEKRRVTTDLVHLFKIINGFIDISHDVLFDFNQINIRGHNLNTRQKNCRLNCSKCLFIPRVIPTWNNLPSCIAETRTVGDFKRKLETINLNVYCTT